MNARLTLYVSGDSTAARRVAGAIRSWCDRELGGRYRLDVLDIREWPREGAQAHVLATPLLVLEQPPARVVGDLADVPRVMAALGLADRDAAD